MEKKHVSVNLFKRVLSLALAFVMLLGMVPVTHAHAASEETTLYLKPNSNWLGDGARFAIYCWDSSNSSIWTDLYGPDENGVYEGSVPAGYNNVIFCRMNPSAEENGWDYKWNQTSDLTVPTDGTNLYTVADGTWDQGGGTWSVYGEEEEPEESSTPASESTPDVSEGEDEDLYVVAGDKALCGTEWDPANTDNRMTLTSDGTYQKVFTNVAAGTYNLKVTDGTWNNSWGEANSTNNYTFVVSAVCDVTVTFDPETTIVTVSGDNVGKETGLEITTMHAVGNGSGAWLNDASWDTTANIMTETAEGIYEITFEDVPAGTAYQFKFAANGSWTHSWGGGGAQGEAVYNGQNIPLSIEYTLADVTLKLDMTGYNHEAKSGATYSVTVTEAAAEPEVPAVEYYLVGYINGADYGCEADYANLGEYKFVDGKLTAKFDSDSYVFVKTGDNAHWYLFESYVDTTSGTLYENKSEKMRVPAGTEWEFTLVENGDGSLTLSYAEVTSEPEVPAVEYYLVGYINGADYGCNDDYANLGEYKFVDGKLTAKFDSDSYVFVKTGDNAHWYLFESYVDTASGTLYENKSEKMFVPAGTEWEFTLVENEDGSLTLSYAEAPDTTDVTLHFFKPEGWGSTINAYLWATGAVPGYEEYNSWPGKAVSANASHAGWYDLVVSTETPMAFNFIFNDGGNQTADLYTGEVSGDTELWIVGSDVSSTAPGEWSGDYDYTAYLHFQKPADWADTINAWIWDANGAIPGYEDYNTTWPGKAVEADAINPGWYNIAVTVDENTGFSIIFNDGTYQTADLITGTLDVKTHLWVVDQQLQTEAPAGWRDPSRTIHVPGTFPGPSWDAASNQMSWDAELGLYVYTFEDVPAANYEYKISVNGSWNENYGAGGVRDGSNIAVAVPETMDVTIYYNDESHNSVCSVTYIFADVTLSGTGIPQGTVLTDKDLTGIYSVTVPMVKGTYTDLVITCDGVEYPFAEVEIDEDKDVTFYMDPVTEIFYCDASEIPVNTAAIYFDSQMAEYKQPFGAAATGEDVHFAIDTGADITSAVLVVKGIGSYPMTAEDTETGKRWRTTASFSAIGEYDYYFSLSNGSTVAIYSDDDGYYGAGQVTDLTGVKPYDLVVYKAGFETPDWMKNAVIYQIFPDRFFDGDVSNNQTQTWARGEVDYEYIPNWYTLPENPEQETMIDKDTYLSTGAHFGDGQWSNEIYGGDLEGITERIDYLKALGVNVIYLNPIFWSISNHRYDAVDYTEIDPILGTMGDFRELVKVAEENGMHIILDGVFNHVSDDSVYFDRYYKFLGTSNKIGAYPYWAYVYDYMSENKADKATAEAAAKAFFGDNYGITDYSYTKWFQVSSTVMAGTVDNIGLRAGKEVYSYEGWWGYDSMPVIYSTNGSEYQTGNWAEEIIYNANETSVTQYWISQGNNGWRLDVANEVSDETWQRFRDSVKALDSDAVIIGEIWDDATKYLKGDMYDSVMNYLFRNASIGFAMGTGALDTMMELEKIRERYPEEAFYAMMNLVGSHDTTRLLSYLDGIGDDRADKSLEAAFPTYENTSDEAKQMQYLVAFLQFTYAGAPTIYYGDEIGMVGADDPDDRRAMEWGKGNKELVEWYAKLAAIRAAYPALRTGEVAPMILDSDNLLGYVRQDSENTLHVIANNNTSEVSTTLSGTYVDLISGKTFTDTITVPANSGVILAYESDVKTISVNYAGLAPAYDSRYIVAERPAPEHTHKYNAVVTEPDCLNGGYTTYTCDCGDTYVSREVPALGHAFDEVVTEATCTEEGSIVRTCSVCSHSETETIGALGHSYTSQDSEGIRTYTCGTCGDTYESKIYQVFSGKSLTLKAVGADGKAISAKKLLWTLDAEEYSACASVNASGKVTARKIYSKQDIQVTAALKSDPTVKFHYTVVIYPAVTQLEIRSGDKLVGGKTIPMDFSEEKLTLSAALFPADTLQKVTWSVSDKKEAYADYTWDDTTLTITNTGKQKAGTVTIKATANAGAKKTVTVKVTFGSFAKAVVIDQPAKTTIKGGETLKLTAKITEPASVTKPGVTWSFTEAYCKNYATINAKTGALKAKNVAHPTAVSVVATSKDGKAVSEPLTIAILPKTEGKLLLTNGVDYVNGTTQHLDKGLTYPLFPEGLAEDETVTWTSGKESVATVDENGVVTAVAKGSAKITATASGGRSVSVTFKVATMAREMTLSTKNGKNLIEENGETLVQVASGKTVTLSAKVLTAGATKSVTWSVTDGSAYARISSSGKLTAAKNLTSVQYVTVTAKPKDAYGIAHSIRVKILPLAQGIHVYSIDETTGQMILSVDSTKSSGLLGMIRANAKLKRTLGDKLQLSATVYPFYGEDDSRNASQDVTWKSSNKKVALVHEDGSVELLKTGTVTITATAADGSGKKISFKLNVVAP